MSSRIVLAATLAAGLAIAVLPPATASAASGPTIVVVADGLNAPRGLVYDRPHRRVLVAEAGNESGNTGPCGAAERGLPMCLGHTGSVYQHSERGGHGRRIITGLPSTALQGGPTVVIGVHDLSLHGGRLTGVIGALGNAPYRTSLGPSAALLGHVVSLREGAPARPIADVVGFQDALHPGHIEANPYGVITGPFGIVVANAGGPGTNRGNDLLKVDRHGSISQLAQFPERPSVTDPATRIRAVPTSVARGPDGAYYVGELTGAPFFAGEARIWRVVPGQAPTVYAQGLTTIVDLVFDHAGRLIVLQTSSNPFDSTGEGSLLRIGLDGARTVLVGAGLVNPGGVAVAGRDTFYVTTRMASGGGVGQLVKVTL